MKLLAQTSRRYLFVSLITLLISSGLLFWGVRRLFDHYSNEQLLQLEEEIKGYAVVHDTLPIFFQSTSSKLSASRCATIPVHYFSDTLLLNEIEQEEEPFRCLHFGLSIHGAAYQVSVLQSAVETEDIVGMILLLNLALILVTIIALFWAQKRLSERLWKPFYETLERLRTFHIGQFNPLILTKTDTDEFAELNTALIRLTEKTRSDYFSLKRFTENASHEIQTPLAVIQAKLDTLFQLAGMSDEQLTHLNSAQRAAARLSRLQQNLLLLVKIENDQFQHREIVDIKRILNGRLEFLEDFIVAKKLQVITVYAPVQRQINLFLAESLIGNLLGNAVKHNLPEGGWITVELSEKALIISNSGPIPEGPIQKLTDRFQRSSSQAEGLGLGLAIAKEICDTYGWILQINFEQSEWKTTVQF